MRLKLRLRQVPMSRARSAIPLSRALPPPLIQSKMADLLGSILSSMEKPPTVGDQESRRKARGKN